MPTTAAALPVTRCDYCTKRRPVRTVTEGSVPKQACDGCIGIRGPRRSKMGNRRVVAALPGGPRLMDSKLERDYIADLYQRQAAGDVSDIVVKPRLELFPGFFYRCDVAFTERLPGGRTRRVWADPKGQDTQRWRDVVKAWRIFGPGPLLEVKRGRHGGFVITREIHGDGARVVRADVSIGIPADGPSGTGQRVNTEPRAARRPRRRRARAAR